MIELLLTVCLAGSPGECKREILPFRGDLLACAMFGEIAAVDWLSQRPRWRLKSYTCRTAERAT
jgi:hypothetical protein